MKSLVPSSHIFGDIVRSDPFFYVDDWFKGFGLPRPFFSDKESVPPIKIDLKENDKNYTILAEIPGVKKEDVKVQVDGNLVTISAEVRKDKEEKKGDRVIRSECCQGSSFRSFTLESNVDESKAKAKYENGMLELILPKKKGGAAKQIQIK